MTGLISNLIKTVIARPSLGVIAALSLVIAGLGLDRWYLSVRLDSVSAKLEAKELALETVTRDYETTLVNVNRVNKAIAELNSRAEAQQIRLAEATAQSRKTRIEYRDRVRTVEKTTVSKGCAEALDWGITQATDLVQDWNHEKK